MRCTRCQCVIQSFTSLRGECLECTIFRAKWNELFWTGLHYLDYCEAEVINVPEKENQLGFMLFITVKPDIKDPENIYRAEIF